MKVYFDGEATPFAQLANAPINQENTNGKSCGFYIFDTYSDNHGTKGVLDCTDKKYIRFPTLVSGYLSDLPLPEKYAQCREEQTGDE